MVTGVCQSKLLHETKWKCNIVCVENGKNKDQWMSTTFEFLGFIFYGLSLSHLMEMEGVCERKKSMSQIKDERLPPAYASGDCMNPVGDIICDGQSRACFVVAVLISDAAATWFSCGLNLQLDFKYVN